MFNCFMIANINLKYSSLLFHQISRTPPIVQNMYLKTIVHSAKGYGVCITLYVRVTEYIVLVYLHSVYIINTSSESKK